MRQASAAGPDGAGGGQDWVGGGQQREGLQREGQAGGGLPGTGPADTGPASPPSAPAAPAAEADAEAADSAVAQAQAAQAQVAQAHAALAERTADLQRLQAEYANYRKRVERDRLAVREQALANVLNELVPVLDDIGRAREHGELTGGFKSVAESLEGIATKLGLSPFGEPGDPFDPTLHEALMHSYSPDVTEPTAVQILQPGYRVGERIIRPARVAVAEPGGAADEALAEPVADEEGTPDADGPGSGSAGSASAG